MSRRSLTTAVLAACVAASAFSLAAPGRAAAGGAWVKATAPFPHAGVIRTLSTFGPLGVAAGGDGGAVAVSTDGGATWASRPVTAVAGDVRVWSLAFLDAADAWAVAGGAVLSTVDGGLTWQRSTLPAPDDWSRVISTGANLYATGRRGVATSTDGGTSWQIDPTVARQMGSVAATSGGDVLAGGPGGALYLRPVAGTWTPLVAGTSADVIGVALAPSPVWNKGPADLAAITGTSVLTSDDAGASFATLVPPPPGILYSVALSELPDASILVGAGGGTLLRYSFADSGWTSASGWGDGDVLAVATAPVGSLAYAGSEAGVLERTVSGGATPLALTVSSTKITVGDSVDLTALAWIHAGGKLVVQRRQFGATAWHTIEGVDWTLAGGAGLGTTDSPTGGSSYRAAFYMDGNPVAASTITKVTVMPTVTVAQGSITRRRGSTYRLSGTVRPAHPGGKVILFTDRGGGWRRVSPGAVVALQGGTRFETRLFGCPKRETYHMKVVLPADKLHPSASSRTITVTID